MLAESKNQTNNKLVRVICPICKADKEINIPIEIIKQTPALTTISIPNGLICQHHFQMFVDKNYKVRGYQKVDFQFETKRPDDNKENTS